MRATAQGEAFTAARASGPGYELIGKTESDGDGNWEITRTDKPGFTNYLREDQGRAQGQHASACVQPRTRNHTTPSSASRRSEAARSGA